MRLLAQLEQWLDRDEVFARERTPTDKRALGIAMVHGGLSCRRAGELVGRSGEAVREWQAKAAALFRARPRERRKRIAVDEKVMHLPGGDAYLWAAVDLDTEEPIALQVTRSRWVLDALTFMRRGSVRDFVYGPDRRDRLVVRTHLYGADARLSTPATADLSRQHERALIHGFLTWPVRRKPERLLFPEVNVAGRQPNRASWRKRPVRPIRAPPGLTKRDSTDAGCVAESSSRTPSLANAMPLRGRAAFACAVLLATLPACVGPNGGGPTGGAPADPCAISTAPPARPIRQAFSADPDRMAQEIMRQVGDDSILRRSTESRGDPYVIASWTTAKGNLTLKDKPLFDEVAGGTFWPNQEYEYFSRLTWPDGDVEDVNRTFRAAMAAISQVPAHQLKGVIWLEQGENEVHLYQPIGDLPFDMIGRLESLYGTADNPANLTLFVISTPWLLPADLELHPTPVLKATAIAFAQCYARQAGSNATLDQVGLAARVTNGTVVAEFGFINLDVKGKSHCYSGKAFAVLVDAADNLVRGVRQSRRFDTCMGL